MCIAMADWIDSIFDELDGRVVDEATRFRLEDLLETAKTEGREYDDYVLRINAHTLTHEGVTDLFRELNQLQLRTPELYAPSQTDLAQWLRTFC